MCCMPASPRLPAAVYAKAYPTVNLVDPVNFFAVAAFGRAYARVVVAIERSVRNIG
jgi:hypothetical protein